MSQAGLEKFTADNPWIFDLISHFDEDTPTIPWGSVTISGDYTRYMLGIYNKASSAVNSLDMDRVPTSREATNATKELFDQTKGTWNKIVNVGILSWESVTGGMPVVYEVLAQFSAGMFIELEQGFHLHASGIAKQYLKHTEKKVAREMMKGRMTQAEGVAVIRNTEAILRNHADVIQEGLGALAYLDKEGWYDTQKKGLGAPLVPIVLGLVAIAALALVIVAVYQISTVNQIIKEECSKFEDEEMRLACIKTVSEAGFVNFDALSGNLFKWLTIGGLVVGGVMFAPAITRSVLGARKELKAAQ